MYMFVSFASLHTGKNLGCCIVKSDNKYDTNKQCIDLGLMPEQCNECRGYPLTEEQFQKQGMELNKFYTKEQMIEMGFTIS